MPRERYNMGVPFPLQNHLSPWISFGIFIAFLFTGTGTTLGVLWSIRLIVEAERAADLQRHLILSEERLRFSQEVHDTLGQRLAAISIKAELAKNLALRDDPQLLSEITEIQQITRTAATEVRGVIHGYGDIDVTAEIRASRALLHDAGITLHITGSVHDIPLENRDVSAWFIRETTTNILKHSRATMAQLSLSPAAITMYNDGAGPSSSVPRLSGLEALRLRAAWHHESSLHVSKKRGKFHVTLMFSKENK